MLRRRFFYMPVFCFSESEAGWREAPDKHTVAPQSLTPPSCPAAPRTMPNGSDFPFYCRVEEQQRPSSRDISTPLRMLQHAVASIATDGLEAPERQRAGYSAAAAAILSAPRAISYWRRKHLRAAAGP